MLATILAWVLKRSVSEKDRTLLLNAINTSIDAVPLRAMIVIDESRQILVNGKQLTPEQRESVVQGAYSALNNTALNTIREQVRWKAINEGYLSTLDPTKASVFYKAALWYAQEEKNLLSELASQHSTL